MRLSSIKQFSFFSTQFFFLLLFSIFMTVHSEAASKKNPFLVIQESDKAQGDINISSSIKLNLSESPEGVKLDLHYNNRPTATRKLQEKIPPGLDIPAGGQVITFLDDMLVFNQTFTGEELKISKVLDMSMITNGAHTLRCEINSFPSGLQKKEITFQLDATPVIDIQAPKPEKLFDPWVTLHLFGQMDGNSGNLKVHVDEQLVADFSINPGDVNKTKKLSELLGNRFEVSGLMQGTHLLSITAMAINGSTTVEYVNFEVNAKPEVSVNMGNENKFSSFSVTFPKVSTGYFGNVEVFFKKSVILSKQVEKDSQFTLSRSEIEEALKKHNHTITQYPVDLVFAVRAGNATEKWTRIEYR